MSNCGWIFGKDGNLAIQKIKNHIFVSVGVVSVKTNQRLRVNNVIKVIELTPLFSLISFFYKVAL